MLPSAKGEVGVIVTAPAEISALEISEDPITVALELMSSTSSFATTLSPVSEISNRGCTMDVMLSEPDAPVSSAVTKSGTPGAL